MAYALMVEKLQAERRVMASLLSSGMVEGELPDQYRLDVALGLVEEPGRDEAEQEWREAVGLPV